MVNVIRAQCVCKCKDYICYEESNLHSFVETKALSADKWSHQNILYIGFELDT